jgi:hypothetical protein
VYLSTRTQIRARFEREGARAYGWRWTRACSAGARGHVACSSRTAPKQRESAGAVWNTGRVSAHAFSGEELQTRNAGRTALELGGARIELAHGRARQARCCCLPAVTSRAVR